MKRSGAKFEATRVQLGMGETGTMYFRSRHLQAVGWSFMISILSSQGVYVLHPGLHPAFDLPSLPTVCAVISKRWLIGKDVNRL